MVYLEVCKFEKNTSVWKIFVLRIPSPRIPRQVCRVQIWRSWYFFKRDIQPRGKSTATNAWQYHILQSSANFFAHKGFMGIFNMSFLIPCRTKWHQKSFDVIFSGFNPSPTSLYRSNDKTAILMFHLFHGTLPIHLQNRFSRSVTARSTRRINTFVMVQARTNIKSMFLSVYEVKLWNSLSTNLRDCNSVIMLRKIWRNTWFQFTSNCTSIIYSATIPCFLMFTTLQ